MRDGDGINGLVEKEARNEHTALTRRQRGKETDALVGQPGPLDIFGLCGRQGSSNAIVQFIDQARRRLPPVAMRRARDRKKPTGRRAAAGKLSSMLPGDEPSGLKNVIEIARTDTALPEKSAEARLCTRDRARKPPGLGHRYCGGPEPARHDSFHRRRQLLPRECVGRLAKWRHAVAHLEWL